MEFVTFTDFADALFLVIGNDVYKRYMWVYLLIGAIGFAIIYAFKAVALFTIARREGYNNSWMAFVPFLNTYYIGVVSEKNKIFNIRPKNMAIVAAVAEFLYVVLNVIYYVAQFLIFQGGYATPDTGYMVIGNVETPYFTGTYTLAELPASLEWAGWVNAYFANAFLSWLSIICLLSNIFVLIAFFQTYSCRYYVLFSLLSAIFPLSGIFIFVVRNNAGKNYAQYLKEKQYRQYQQYQEYMRQNGGFNNPNGSDPYNGGSAFGSAPPKDPFDGMGSSDNGANGGSSGSGSDDPFGDF